MINPRAAMSRNRRGGMRLLWLTRAVSLPGSQRAQHFDGEWWRGARKTRGRIRAIDLNHSHKNIFCPMVNAVTSAFLCFECVPACARRARDQSPDMVGRNPVGSNGDRCAANDLLRILICAVTRKIRRFDMKTRCHRGGDCSGQATPRAGVQDDCWLRPEEGLSNRSKKNIKYSVLFLTTLILLTQRPFTGDWNVRRTIYGISS
jgi:hypothetical protein